MSYEYDYLFKILIVGDSHVGKSCMLTRYVDDSFTESYAVTIGVDFRIRTIELNKKVIKIQIWDTAGQDRFRSIVTSYYKGSNGIILAYSIDSRESFNQITQWINDCERYASENVCKILVGTKTDLDKNRTVTKLEGDELAKKLGIPFIEISSKLNTNVELAFETLMKGMLKFYENKKIKSNTNKVIENKSISLKTNKQKAKGSCC